MTAPMSLSRSFCGFGIASGEVAGTQVRVTDATDWGVRGRPIRTSAAKTSTTSTEASWAPLLPKARSVYRRKRYLSAITSIPTPHSSAIIGSTSVPFMLGQPTPSRNP